MTETVVIFASKFGCTKNAAQYIADRLDADIFNLKIQSVIDLSRFKRVLIGTGIYAGKPSKVVVEFVEQNKGQLDGRKVGLFMCCSKDDESGDEQCKNVSAMLGIENAVFFANQRKKIKDRDSPKLNEYIEKLEKDLF